MTERKRTSGWKRGFTLAEMLVTVLIIIITLLLGAFAYTQWVLASQFRHNNTVADTMFSVLQSELSERRAANRLDEVEASFKRTNSGATVFKDYAIIAPSGTTGIDYVNIYSGYNPEATNSVGPERGPIYSVIGTKSEWAEYCENKDSITKPALRMVYDMLSEYMFEGDVDLLNGDICVELDPSEGLIYSVFFTQQVGSEGLNYTGSNPNLLDRRTSQRRMHLRNDHKHDLVGYSGVEQLSISTSKVTTKPIIQNLMLNNEETLNLTFNLNPDLATNLMSYTITLFDSNGNKKLATIEMNNLNIDGAINRDIYNLGNTENSIVDCKVTRFDGDTKQEEMMSFPAWIDTKGKIHLVLDAVDYKTSLEKVQDAYGTYSKNSNGSLFCDALKNTFSIYRLGIQDTDNLYCTVYGEGGGFSTTATKTSNTANRAFATSTAKTHNFAIANARHLYNLRFEESAKAANNDLYANTFTLRNDVNMNTIQVFSNYEKPSDSTGTINTLPINRNKSVLLSSANASYFPSFEQLGKGSVFESSGANGFAIRNLKISKANNIATLGFTPNSASDNYGTGLFLINNGTIRKTVLNNVSVEGKTVRKGYDSDRTGSFCGTDAGILTALKTTGTTSSVTGQDYVGGIFGYYDETIAKANGYNATGTKITDLSNEASVTGSHYVGGIVGLLSGERTNGTTDLVIDNCKNFGAVYAADKNDAYIGGIVGLADSVDLTNCISNPQNTGNNRNGYFVGGIAGLAYNSKIDQCGTALQQGYGSGMISGNRYVGGIVGLSVSSSVGSSNGKACVNEIAVAGNSYVGGIAGSNAKVEVLTTEVEVGKTEFEGLQGQTIDQFIKANGKTWYENLDPVKVSTVSEAADTDNVIEIRNWVNKGVVSASDYYSGGITGFNTGRIIDCTTTVYQGSSDVKTCSYAGGIAGYNNGTLAASNENATLSVECYVTGKDFVGGVVGYNDQNATVHNYKVSGGKVLGSGTFTGGYAGFNASVNLLQNTDGTPLFIEANLNRIEGNVAVGGVIGGNVVPVVGLEGIKATFNVNNFLGSIEGKTAVGGYVGYNAIPSVGSASVVDTLRARANTVCTATQGKNNAEVLKTLDTMVEGWGVNTKGLSIGPVDESKMIVAYASSIKGEVAVGGVIGYGNRYTALTVNNVENKIPVTATKAITYAELNDLLRNGSEPDPIPVSGVYPDNSQTYSLVGGIIGIVNQNTVLNNCYNADIGDVNGVGTYLGGLTEVNFGQIQNCKVASIGNTGHSSVGGLVGVNIGNITGTNPSNATVTGLKYTGGFASENYGEINLNKTMKNGSLVVNAKGEATGGVVGYNGANGKITMAEYVKITVESSAKTVGGMIGENDGGVIVAVGDNGTFNGSVTGFDMVGGIVGLQKSGDLRLLTNNASVTSTGAGGNAAGIVGEIGLGSVENCVNTGIVLSATGNAAGIVGVNRNKVLSCTNYGPVTAPGGNAGGICVENIGTIESCALKSQTGKNIEVKGLLNAGGITALNRGELISNTLESADISNYADSDATSTIGGIAGTNYTTINLDAKNLMKDVAVTTNANGSSMGGIAGLNLGTIQNGTVKGSEEVVIDAGQATEFRIYEYIETQQTNPGNNTSGSYFDLGYIPNANTEVVFDGMVVSGDTALFGTRVASGNQQFGIQYDSNQVYTGRIGGEQLKLDGFAVNTRGTFTLNVNKVMVQSDTLNLQTTRSGAASLYNGPIYVGAINTNGKAGNIGNVRIYSIQIYESGKLVRNYLPAENKAGDIGLLETQSLSFVSAKCQPSNGSTKVITSNEEPKIFYDGARTKTVSGMTLMAGNGVSYANIGNVAGINDNGAMIQNVSIEKGNWDASLRKLLGNGNFGYGGIAGLNRGEINNSHFSGTVNVAGETAAIVNVGGIAGKNETSGVIENCTVGLASKTELDVTGYGYLGGITGWNYGAIISCDSRSEKEKNSGTQDGYPVNITTAKGHTGGIVGYEAAGSLLRSAEKAKIATGSKWAVLCTGYANDNGTGGIIGYSESGNRNESYAYIVNNAAVTMSPTSGAGGSIAVGGIVGRHQNNENANLIFEYCENNGTIKSTNGTSMVGGIIGRLKYYGMTMDHCINNGIVSGTNAGGLMGDGYDCSSNSQFTRCTNFGTVTGSGKAGGILSAGYENSPTLEINVVNCINVGTIAGSAANSGGIMGVPYGSKVYLIRCRNYGSIVNNSSGMANNATLIKDCFDFRATNSIISKNTNPVDSYFYSPNNLSEAEKNALNEWINAGKNLKDETSKEVQTTFANRFALESGKRGLPAVSYVDGEGNLQYSSYRVYDVNSNPVAGIGISNYNIPRIATGLEPLTADAMHNYNEMEIKTFGFTPDGLIEQYYRDKYPTLTNTKVLNLKLEQTGAVVKATWTEMSGAYAYKLRYYAVDADGTVLDDTYYVSPTVYSNFSNITVPAEWSGATIHVEVRAVDGLENSWDASENTGGFNESADDSGKEWAEAELVLSEILPTPTVVLELGAVKADGLQPAVSQYVAVLKNTEVFDTYLDALRAKGVTNPVVTITVDNTEGNTGKYTIKYNGEALSSHSIASGAFATNNNNATIRAGATCTYDDNGTTVVAQSQKSSQQSAVFNGSSLTATKMIQTTFNGFKGAMPNELEYSLSNYGTLSFSFFYINTEIVSDVKLTTDGGDLYVPMAVTLNTSVMQQDNRTQTISLTNIPEDLLEGENPTVSSQKFIVRSYPWYGQNRAVYYGHDVASNITDISALLALIDTERNESIFEGTTLKAGYIIDRKVAEDGSISYDVRYSALVAKSDYGINVSECTYTYDTTVRGAQNHVVVNGAVDTYDTSDKLLRATDTMQPYAMNIECVTEGSENEYVFTWNDSLNGEIDQNAQYVLQLYGVDVEDTSKTHVFLAESGKLDFASNNKDGKWQYKFTDTENKWNYGELYVRVIKVGTVSGAYTTVWPYYNEQKFTQKQRFTTITAPTVTVPEDANTMDYRLSWTALPTVELNSGELLTYEVTIKDVTEGIAEEDRKPTTVLYTAVVDGKTVLVDEKPTEAQPISDTSATMTLDAYDNCNIAVSIKAIAVENSATFRDGADGTPRILMMTTRLPKPDITKLSMTPIYAADDSVERASIVENGLTLSAVKDDRYGDVSGQYELKLTVGTHEIVLTSKTMAGLLNAGDSAYAIPNELTDVDGNVVKLSDYAGQNVKVKLRAIADSHISSYWSEEGVYRIPRMNLTAPELNANAENTQKTNEYPVYVVNKADGSIGELDSKANVKQETVSWSDDATDGGYLVRITASTDTIDDIPQRTAYEFVFTRNADGKLEYNGTKLNGDMKLDGYTRKTYTEIENNENYSGTFTEIHSMIRVENGKVILSLPDNSELDASVAPLNTTGAWTQNVTVKALKSIDSEFYLDSKSAYLNKTVVDNNAIWNGTSAMYENELSCDAIGTYDADSKTITVTTNDTTRVMVEVTVDGNKLEFAMVATQGGVNTLDLNRLPEGWTGITGLRYRYILSADCEMVTDWSELQTVSIAAPVKNTEGTDSSTEGENSSTTETGNTDSLDGNIEGTGEEPGSETPVEP